MRAAVFASKNPRLSEVILLSVVTYKDSRYEVGPDESVLDVLLRHDIDIPYACKAGVCHVCVMRCQQGDLPINSIGGLTDSEVAHGYFLSCQCVPEGNLDVNDVDEYGIFTQAKVIEKDYPSGEVCRIKLRTATDLYYRAGQFINLRIPVGEIRSYSLASLPTQDDFLELHIKRMRNGVVSNWLYEEVQVGDILEIQGPFGDCYYMPGNIGKDMLMISTGTGIAPLSGILREAIESGHRGQINLYHGERDPSGLYLNTELSELVASHSNIQYFPCANSSGGLDMTGIHRSRASELAFANSPKLDGCSIYLCGSPSMVDESSIQAQLNGAEINKIYADSFVTKDLRLGKER